MRRRGPWPDDIEHWLADEPVSAYPEPWTMRARRWLGRHRTLVTAGAASVLVTVVALVAGLVVVTAAKEQETLARNTAEEQRTLADAQRDKAQETCIFRTCIWQSGRGTMRKCRACSTC